ncbi:nectin 1a isoform X2 [Denticeps clupeoides]|nr:nectin-1-like isoform X2 [Denticeps clupeoides]
MHYNMWMNLLVAFMISGGQSQVVDMDTTRCGYAGSQVDLSCRFINSNPPVKVSQVTWQKLINGTKQNVAIANPALGVSVLPPFRERVKFKNPAVRRPMPSLEDTTITFSALQLSDEAEYICEYTTFPAGNRENTVNLTVNARPMIQMSLSTPTIVAGSSSSKMTVATCLSANGKPPGVITWDTMLDGETDTQETRNPDGTITVRSDYLVVPSQKIHKQKLTCITTYHNERFTDSVTLNIQYEPEVTIEGFDGNWYLNRENVQLKCQVDANPPVSLYQWRFLNGSIPNKVEIRENILLFKEPVSYQLTGTYVCDATNSIGTRSASVDVVVTELSKGHRGVMQNHQGAGVALAMMVGGSVLLAAVTLSCILYHWRQNTFKRDYCTKKQALESGYRKAGGLLPYPPLPLGLIDSDRSELSAQTSSFTVTSLHVHNLTNQSTKSELERWGFHHNLVTSEDEIGMEVSVDFDLQTDVSDISKEE